MWFIVLLKGMGYGALAVVGALVWLGLSYLTFKAHEKVFGAEESAHFFGVYACLWAIFFAVTFLYVVSHYY